MSKETTYTYNIGEHTYITPSVPNKKDIMYNDKPKEQQCWVRQDFPEVFLDYIPQYTEFDKEATMYDNDGLLKSLNVHDSKMVYDLIVQERDRRRHGLWFYNDGEPTYVTGSHYFMLQWCKLYAVNANIDYESFKEMFGLDIPYDEFNRVFADYGRYLEFQRDIFYLIDNVDKNKQRAGLFLTKAKKTGVTMLIGCHILNLATMNHGKQIGIMSKKTDDAIGTNFLYIYHSFMGLPKVMQPMYSNLPKEKGNIFFGAKIFRGNNKKQRALSQIEMNSALNTRVSCVPTKIKGFDAPVVFIAWIDELPKLFGESHISVRDLFDTTLATVKFQQTITGKMYLTGYVSEDNDEGVDDARNIYFDSKLKTQTEGSNRTKSELICHHVSSLYSYLSLIDKYGKCNEKEANRLIQEALDKSKSDARTYQSMMRQNARNEKEAWGIGGQRSLFNPVTIGKRIEEVEDYMRDSATPVGIYGYLRWDMPLWEMGKKNRRPLGKISNVQFVPLTEEDILSGAIHKMTLYKRVKPEDTNLAVRFGKDEKGNYIAPAVFKYVGGTDPVNYSSDVVEGSKISSHTFSMYNEAVNAVTGKIESKVITADFFYRSDNPDENYEDILKEIVFFGKLSIVEGNTPYVAERLIREGFSNYLVFKNADKVLCMYKPFMKYGEDIFLVRRSANADSDDMMNYMTRCAMTYLDIIKDEPNYLNEIWDIILLKQILKFDPKNTRAYDKVMSFMYGLVCYDVYNAYLLEGNDDEFGSMANYSAILNALSA